jgi:hypothetical protein
VHARAPPQADGQDAEPSPHGVDSQTSLDFACSCDTFVLMACFLAENNGFLGWGLLSEVEAVRVFRGSGCGFAIGLALISLCVRAN